eukprot:g25298.t1
MPIISFSQNVEEDAKVLATLSIEVLTQFVKLAVQNIEEGKKANSQRMYNSAAKTLGLEVQTVTQAILLLSHLLLLGAKRNLSSSDFLSSCTELHLPASHLTVLTEAYTGASASLRQKLKAGTQRLPHYRDLDWRLDVEIASRSASNLVRPSFVLNLSTVTPSASGQEQDKPGLVSERYFETDFATLSYMCDELDNAIKEASSQHVHRMLRYVR